MLNVISAPVARQRVEVRRLARIRRGALAALLVSSLLAAATSTSVGPAESQTLPQRHQNAGCSRHGGPRRRDQGAGEGFEISRAPLQVAGSAAGRHEWIFAAVYGHHGCEAEVGQQLERADRWQEANAGAQPGLRSSKLLVIGIVQRPCGVRRLRRFGRRVSIRRLRRHWM